MIQQDWERDHLKDSIYLLEEKEYICSKLLNDDNEEARIVTSGWDGHEPLWDIADDREERKPATIQGSESSTVVTDSSSKRL